MASFEDFDDDRDQIYVSGLPTDITEQQLADHFGQIGMIKMDKKKRPPTPKASAACAGRTAAGCLAPPRITRAVRRALPHPNEMHGADLDLQGQGHRRAQGRRHHYL